MSAPGLARLLAAYTDLRPETVEALAACYAEDAQFKDPFNDVRGRAAIARIFHHLFWQVDAPQFVVTQCLHEGDAAMLCWDFSLRFRGEAKVRVIRGASALRFDAQGLVVTHRDYWDAAEELYAHLPLVGRLMRFLQRRLAAH